MKHIIATLASAAFMSEIVPTVQIETENGPVTINLSDYDPAKHTAVGAAAPAPVQAPEPQQQPATGDASNGGAPAPAGDAGTMLVSKKGKNFIVVDAAGNAVLRDGIEPDGYKTEGDAWAAVMALPKA